MAYAILEFLTLDEVEVPSVWIKGNRWVWPPQHSKGKTVVTKHFQEASGIAAFFLTIEVFVKGLFGMYQSLVKFCVKIQNSEGCSCTSKNYELARRKLN